MHKFKSRQELKDALQDNSHAPLNVYGEASRNRRLRTGWKSFRLRLLSIETHVDSSAPVVPLTRGKASKMQTLPQ
jgi:hypothetical protein